MFQSVTSLIPFMLRISFMVAFILIFDFYAYQAVKTLTADSSQGFRKGIRVAYWVVNISFYIMAFLAMGGFLVHAPRIIYVFVTGFFAALFFAKVLISRIFSSASSTLPVSKSSEGNSFAKCLR
jgi:hypothetical protein